MKTYGEQFESALACNTRAQASEWMGKEIAEYRENFGHTFEHARDVIMHNLGYFTGYYDRATAEKIYFLFGAKHPIFGMTEPTPEEAFAAGQKAMEDYLNSKGKK